MMINNYTFLTDHSYSLRPVSDDDDNNNNNNEELSLKKKKKTSRRSSNRMNKTISNKTHRTVSIDRSSSDKENNSISTQTISKSKRTSIGGNSRKKLTNKKMPIKKTTGSIVKKTKVKTMKQMDLFDALPSLSIEERVKLRRTKVLPPAAIILPKKSQTSTKKISKTTKSKTPLTKKSTKLFLGSGLDLDNIVSGNRQRRFVQT